MNNPVKKIQIKQRQLPVVTYDPRANGALCDECPCNGNVVVPPILINEPQALIIGQEPGHLEVWKRESFVGPSGNKINKILKKYSLDRANMSITNAALCLPKKDEDRDKTIKCCAPRLHNEIAALPSSVPIITLGAHAFRSAYGKKIAITKARGFVWKKDGREFYPTLHPAFVLRDSVQYPLFSKDFKRIAKRLHDGKLDLFEPKNVIYPKNISELKSAIALFKHDKWIACDIETSREPATICTLDCVGWSNLHTTVVVPWIDPQYAPIIAEFFSRIKVVGHNFILFDSVVLDRYGMPTPDLEDSLVAHHAYASHFRQGMDHCVSVYLDSEPWKIKYGMAGSDEKGRPKSNLSEDALYLYNSYDNYLQAHLWAAMQQDVAANKELYEHDKKLALICKHMNVMGVLVDRKRRDDLSREIHAKIDRLFAEMKILAGRDFAPTKPNDIRDILFNHFGAPVLEITEKTGQPSTGKKTLQAFAMKKDRPYGQFAARLIMHRMCSKLVVTHVDKLPIEIDGRLHSSWRSFATPTGRMGCRAPNLTNVKRADPRFKDEPEYKIREIYVSPKGTRLVAFDLEQIEPRIAAYLSGDPAFIAAVESGDVHTFVARLIFGDIPELKDSKTAKTIGKSYRQIAKNCGLGVSYGAGADKIFQTLQSDGFPVTFNQVNFALNKLHRIFSVYFEWAQTNLDFCQKHGYLTIGFLSGRKRWLGHAPEPSKIFNSPIQTGAADIMNFRLIELYDHVQRTYNMDAIIIKIIAQIHDAVIFECPDHLVDDLKKDITRIMGQAITIRGKDIVFPIELKDSTVWSEV